MKTEGRAHVLSAAFTLVETLVAVAVAAVAVAIAAVAVAGAQSVFARIAASGPAFDSVLAGEAALETLRADLSAALPSSGFPFSGDASGFRALCLLAADGDAFAPTVVEWGRAPSGGTVRRLSAPSGAPLGTDLFPPSLGPLSFKYRGLEKDDPRTAETGEDGGRGGPERLRLSPAAEFWKETAPSEPPALPAAVEVSWCGASFAVSLPCAALPATEDASER